MLLFVNVVVDYLPISYSLIVSLVISCSLLLRSLSPCATYHPFDHHLALMEQLRLKDIVLTLKTPSDWKTRREDLKIGLLALNESSWGILSGTVTKPVQAAYLPPYD